MSYNIIPTPDFQKLFKKLFKKHRSLKDDLTKLIHELEQNPDLGTDLGGGGIHKIRMAIASKGKGKSGGARVITFVVNQNNEIYLVHIYDKSDIANIPKEQLLKLTEELPFL